MELTRRGLLRAGTATSLSSTCGADSPGPASTPIVTKFEPDGVTGVIGIAQITGPGATSDTSKYLRAVTIWGTRSTVAGNSRRTFRVGEADAGAKSFPRSRSGGVTRSIGTQWTSNEPANRSCRHQQHLPSQVDRRSHR